MSSHCFRAVALATTLAALAGLFLTNVSASDQSDDSDVDLTLGGDLREFTNSIGMTLVPVKPGTFMMGSRRDEVDRGASEERHEVQITKGFYLGATEVTQKQYKAVMGTNPSFFSKDGKGDFLVRNLVTDDFPVENVSWKDAQAFLEKLDARAEEQRYRVTYRLPTEAEWEYAARGGPSSSKPYHAGEPSDALSSRQANFNGNYPAGGAAKGPFLQRTCKVGSFRPNKLGLYDVHGNVWEWCSDWFSDDYYWNSPLRNPPGPERGKAKSLRGGSYRQPAASLRVANRVCDAPTSRNDVLGFRVAASVRTN